MQLQQDRIMWYHVRVDFEPMQSVQTPSPTCPTNPAAPHHACGCLRMQRGGHAHLSVHQTPCATPLTVPHTMCWRGRNCCD